MRDCWAECSAATSSPAPPVARAELEQAAAPAPRAAPAAGAPGAAPQQQQPAAPVDQPFDMFGAAPGGGGGAGAAPGGPLAALRNSPQFQGLRAVVQQRPELLQPMLAVSSGQPAARPVHASR
jgi:UV excision repair protein RAD23